LPQRREFLEKEGVAATLTDSSKPTGLLVTTGGWGGGRDRGSAENRIPNLYVANHHYALLYRLASRPGARTRMELEVTNRFLPGPIAVPNTLGEIRGSEKPDEFVVLGAHLDSWDLAQGTTDNGTGSSVVLEAARVLAKVGVAPKRTIRFVLFSGEEQGLYGSRAYVAKHKDEMEKTSAALVHDTGTGQITGLGTGDRPTLGGVLERELGVLETLGVRDFRASFMGGSDHQSFEGLGVPGIMFRQDPATYRLTHHTQVDTLDQAVAANLAQGAKVMALCAWHIANRDTLLPREKVTRQRGRFGKE